MTGIGGTFDDEDDFYLFLEMSSNKATNYEGDDWTNSDNYDTLPEQMERVLTKLEELFERGFKANDQEAFAVNDTLKSYAEYPDDFDWGWWRDDSQIIDLRHEDGVPVGNDSEYLVMTRLHRGAGIIKHTYRKRPDPIELMAVPFEQNGVTAFMGVATAGDLDSISSVPWMDPLAKSKDFANDILNGNMDENQWQRMINHKRVDDIRNFAEQSDKNLFNPVLLYVEDKFVKISGKGKEKKISIPFGFLKEHLGSFTDYFPKPDEVDHRPVWIIDGQHRVRGFGSSKRGSRMAIPFVLLIGDGSVKKVAEIALLFTQINTTSKPLDELHKIYLNYQFCIDDGVVKYGVELDGHGKKIISTYDLPKPNHEGRVLRRSYELALYLAAHASSPILDCVIFQRPAGVNISNKMVADAKAIILNTKQWFSAGIYSGEEADEFANDEVLNFYKALHEHCNSWPDGVLRWQTGRANNKNFLQGRGPFSVTLETHKLCTERIIYREPDVTRPISKELYMAEMNPIRWVDWDARVLKRSDLKGRTNTNIRHLNLWIKTAIEFGVSYESDEILDASIQSVPGKGLIAPPSPQTPIKTSANNFPGLQTLNLEVQIPYHCLSVEWECETSVDSIKWLELRLPSEAIGSEESKKTVAIKGAYLGGARYIKVRAKFTNGIGPTYSEWLEFNHPNVS